MNLISIPAMQDNYIWLLANEQRECLIVDPGVASPVLHYLTENKLTPKAILLTHHHNDHVGGVGEILQNYPDITVYGPQETVNHGCTQQVQGHDEITVLGLNFSVLDVPGHTLGHIAYYAMPYLFCGDTLFSAGCGRIFEGTPEQMYASLQLIAQLPDNTLICCAHEYTESNLRFARYVLPENKEIETYQKQVKELRLKHQPSVPSLLKMEKEINPFLRCYDNDLQRNIGFENHPNETWQVFARLRDMKDSF
ncbi:hydroxyacylglutathione hydrolase [Hafnia paralvei]|uniref:hydroxyacylglutathione hydrolase n=1 Tax=Hafnia paralvei TaxID=546367 RepID=UPI001033C359|nr:hydroxyacylglutathione hydrolase [Hafnia paralvei]TBL99108.1 hydroxyacylglutathione hydrolase [Hafnia paralvei]